MVTRKTHKNTDARKEIPSYFLSVLPFIIAVQDYTKFSPEALITKIGEASKKGLVTNAKIKKELSAYLLHYNYKDITDYIKK